MSISKWQIYIFIIPILFCACNKGSDNPTPTAPQQNTDNPFKGNWALTYKGESNYTRDITIDEKGKFNFDQNYNVYNLANSTYTYVYTNLTGNVSTNGNILSEVIDKTANKSIGTFSGNLSSQNGSGTLEATFVGKTRKWTWTALKK